MGGILVFMVDVIWSMLLNGVILNSVGMCIEFVCVRWFRLLCNRLMIIRFLVWFFLLVVSVVVWVLLILILLVVGVVFFIGCVISWFV